MKLAMIVVAAGQGARFGQAVPKAFVRLGDISLLERSIRVLAAVPAVTSIVPVVAEADLARYAALSLGDVRGLAPVVTGGAERQDSVANGLAALPDDVGWVGVHDAARCLVTVPEIEQVIARARETGGALLARPVRDTIKVVEAGRVVGSPERKTLWAAQTPQVFRRDWLRDAHARAREERWVGTDEAELVTRAGHEAVVVEGSERNIKLTHPGDLEVAQAWLEQDRDEGAHRAGQGAR